MDGTITVTQMLQMIVTTLNGVEVKGKENLSRLLGCINVLESIINKEEETTEETAEDGEPDGR